MYCLACVEVFTHMIRERTSYLRLLYDHDPASGLRIMIVMSRYADA